MVGKTREDAHSGAKAIGQSDGATDYPMASDYACVSSYPKHICQIPV